jgi:outer membrane receptor protein involved in Fe transport
LDNVVLAFGSEKGLEAGVQYQASPWLLYANYALVDATYQFTGLLASTGLKRLKV